MRTSKVVSVHSFSFIAFTSITHDDGYGSGGGSDGDPSAGSTSTHTQTHMRALFPCTSAMLMTGK